MDLLFWGGSGGVRRVWGYFGCFGVHTGIWECIWAVFLWSLGLLWVGLGVLDWGVGVDVGFLGGIWVVSGQYFCVGGVDFSSGRFSPSQAPRSPDAWGLWPASSESPEPAGPLPYFPQPHAPVSVTVFSSLQPPHA